MIVLASITDSEPSIYFSSDLPLSSETDPTSMICNPVTFSSFEITLTGAARNLNFTPSSSAATISSWMAGISFLVLLYTMVTSAPSLLAVLAASIATLPPPITITLFPRSSLSPRPALFKKETP